jgi:hypothetical protein
VPLATISPGNKANQGQRILPAWTQPPHGSRRGHTRPTRSVAGGVKDQRYAREAALPAGRATGGRRKGFRSGSTGAADLCGWLFGLPAAEVEQVVSLGDGSSFVQARLGFSLLGSGLG